MSVDEYPACVVWHLVIVPPPDGLVSGVLPTVSARDAVVPTDRLGGGVARQKHARSGFAIDQGGDVAGVVAPHARGGREGHIRVVGHHNQVANATLLLHGDQIGVSRQCLHTVQNMSGSEASLRRHRRNGEAPDSESNQPPHRANQAAGRPKHVEELTHVTSQCLEGTF